jgi:bis(5'-nucleosidyl)-tetraphosphatase
MGRLVETGRLGKPGAFSYDACMECVLSAGVVVVGQAGEAWRVLLLRAYNYWDCPKGLVEPGEDPLATARREVREETGIEDLDFRWGEVFIETEPYSKNKVARYYLASSAAEKVILGINPALGKAEHHEGRWFAFDDAMPLLVPRLQRVLRWARTRIAGGEP